MQWQAPKGDAYTLRGYESYRDGKKKIFNSMTFSLKPISQFPKGMRKVFKFATFQILRYQIK